tara:strand:- start:628 stop:1044 length:417 start_codon:yes stop_codon:yes gene_type:complete
MKRQLNDRHLNIIFKALAHYQRTEHNENLHYNIKESCLFEKAIWEQKLLNQNAEKKLISELHTVLTTKSDGKIDTENLLVEGITNILQEEFSPLESQRYLKLKKENQEIKEQLRDLKVTLDHQEWDRNYRKNWWKFWK